MLAVAREGSLRRIDSAHTSRDPGAVLPRSFYLRPTIEVAQALLGKLLVHDTAAGCVSGYIVETEAYLQSDPASHAVLRAGGRWVAKMTDRNRQMFGPPGIAYIYFIYGNHYCLNVVTRKEGVAEAVLIRAVEPVAGVELMQQRRHFGSSRAHRQSGSDTAVTRAERDLTNGPGKLTQAFAIDRRHNGADLTSGLLRIERGRRIPRHKVTARPRIGINVAGDDPWRFVVAGSAWLSRP
jgi:DNA-3-methyladenine glycosylase